MPLSRACGGSDNVLLGLVEVVDEIITEIKVCLDDRGRREGKPLAERNILEVVCDGSSGQLECYEG